MARVTHSLMFRKRLFNLVRAGGRFFGEALALGVPIALAACGGEDAGRPSADTPLVQEDGATLDPCRAADGLVFQSIVNFETPAARCDPAVDPTNAMQTSCLYFNYDADSDPKIDPNAVSVLHSPPDCLNVNVPGTCTLLSGQSTSPVTCSQSNLLQGNVRTAVIEGGRCGTSVSAMHLVAKNLSICVSGVTKRQGWGASLAVTFFVSAGGQPTGVYDASAWEGLSFWIRKGSGPSGNGILATVRDPYTGASPSQFAPGGGLAYCDSSAIAYTMIEGKFYPTVPDARKCDPFGGAALLLDEWRFVKLPFDRMQQKGYGVPAPRGQLETALVTGLQFSLSAGDWDFWLDDIAFYRKAP